MSMADAVALALAHYRATTTTAIQFATTGSWWPILNPDGTPEPDDRAIEIIRHGVEDAVNGMRE